MRSRQFLSAFRFVLLLPASLLLQCNSPRNAAALPDNDSTNTFLADPAIFSKYERHYLYGTVERASGNGFLVYTSRNLKDWKRSTDNNGYALKKGEAFGTSGFWAPQVFERAGKYHMAYVANENIAFAQSESPQGPFTQANKESLVAPVKQIDPFVFFDDDGKVYLYHVRLQQGNRIFVAEIESDLSAIKPETLRECVAATEGWENTANASWPVAEGPSVLKRNGVYYLLYTANDFRNPDYAVGYATSNSPLGPWKKYEGNPIISKKFLGWNGTGYGDFFYKGKELYYVFHTHYNSAKPTPRRTALIKLRFAKTESGGERLEAVKESFRFLRKEP